MRKVPLALIFSRLAIGITLVPLSILQVRHYKIIAIVLLSVGLLTDIFDGIIARKYQVSTQTLRRLDSGIDQIFFILVAIATYLQCAEFFKSNGTKLIILLGTEALTYIVSYVKFKKEIATHTIGAKIWTLLLFGILVQIILQCESSLLFEIFFWVGIITRIEIISIIIILKEWTNDVPTFYHSIKLRNGKQIKRHKMFNG
jgi:CDP-diacylglycerol--glycerol-3-phosphate 3-phosphatidyltransferase